MRKMAIALISAGILLSVQIDAEAAVKAGATCSKAGAIATLGGKKFTCIKSGKKLIWNRGVAIIKPTPTPTPERVSVSDPVESCKIVDASNPSIGVYGGGLYGGFNDKSKPVPSSGTVTWYLVPVDFTDLKGEANWRSRVEDQMQLLTEYYDMVSYGKLKIQWKIYDNWITMPGVQKDYSILKSGNYTETEYFWKNALSVVDPKIDFTGVQVVNFLLPKGQSALVEGGQGFPWTGDINLYNSSEFKLSAFTILGNYFSYEYRPYWTYWAHEYGHTIGIPHIGSSQTSYSFQQYDLMGDQDARRELSGWSRFAVTKWLDDKWVYCKNQANIKSEIVYLSELNSKGDGNKLVVIPISATKTLIAESRRSTKFVGSQRVTGNSNGVFVYIYDSTLGHIQQYLTLLPSASDSVLSTNESISYEGVTIKVLSLGAQDKILITKQP